MWRPYWKFWLCSDCWDPWHFWPHNSQNIEGYSRFKWPNCPQWSQCFCSALLIMIIASIRMRSLVIALSLCSERTVANVPYPVSCCVLALRPLFHTRPPLERLDLWPLNPRLPEFETYTSALVVSQGFSISSVLSLSPNSTWKLSFAFFLGGLIIRFPKGLSCMTSRILYCNC